tara:strand:+ start:288 stop:842 length:555 start_codon:yes stop_codon:yes gene_type:complete
MVASKLIKSATEIGKKSVKKKRKPTQSLFSNKPKDRKPTQANVGTRVDPDTGTNTKFSPKPNEKVTKGKKSVEAEQGIAANATKGQRDRAKKYTRLIAKEKKGETLTKQEKKFIKEYEDKEEARAVSATLKADQTKRRRKNPISVSSVGGIDKVFLPKAKRFKKGGKLRGMGVALRGGGKVMKR